MGNRSNALSCQSSVRVTAHCLRDCDVAYEAKGVRQNILKFPSCML